MVTIINGKAVIFYNFRRWCVVSIVVWINRISWIFYWEYYMAKDSNPWLWYHFYYTLLKMIIIWGPNAKCVRQIMLILSYIFGWVTDTMKICRNCSGIEELASHHFRHRSVCSRSCSWPREILLPKACKGEPVMQKQKQQGDGTWAGLVK